MGLDPKSEGTDCGAPNKELLDAPPVFPNNDPVLPPNKDEDEAGAPKSEPEFAGAPNKDAELAGLPKRDAELAGPPNKDPPVDEAPKPATELVGFDAPKSDPDCPKSDEEDCWPPNNDACVFPKRLIC